jgi:hypothetical protein
MGEFLDRFEAFTVKNRGATIKHWVRDHYFEEKAGRESRDWFVEG